MRISLTKGFVVAGVIAGLYISVFAAPPWATAAPGGSGSSCDVSQYSANVSCPLAGREADLNAAKQADVSAHTKAFRARQRNATADTSTNNLGVLYYTQSNDYYCGPATVAMITQFIGIKWPGDKDNQQDDAAAKLGTDEADGTWFHNATIDTVPQYPGKNNYPVADVLDYRLYQFDDVAWYTAEPLPDTPSQSQQDTFMDDLKYDIDEGFPEADNQWAVSVDNNYTSYQPNEPIQHWWAARGYEDSGAVTGLNDPGWDTGEEHWVTTEGSSSHYIVMSLGGRGYIW